MNKEELYAALKEDGAKLRAINFYKRDTLKDLYIERFGVDPDAPVPQPDALEQQDMDSAEQEDTLPEDEAPVERTYSREEPLEPTPVEIEIHTLYFTGGGWCEETGTSYQPGYYRPKTAFEYLALRRFAAEEL